MSRQTNTSERVRTVLLASVMVLSTVGGAIVAGQTVADGSPDDTTAATSADVDAPTDSTDTGGSTEKATGEASGADTGSPDGSGSTDHRQHHH